MKKPRVVNLYAGPGTGKSTTAAALFAELKYQGHNIELVTEYAKDITWERRGPKVFAAQEYIFAKQNFRLTKVADEVELIVTDCPILLTCIYIPENFYMSSLTKCAIEAYERFDNLDVFLNRNKPYNQSGRNHTLSEAQVIDGKILALLDQLEIKYKRLDFGRSNIDSIIAELYSRRWLK